MRRRSMLPSVLLLLLVLAARLAGAQVSGTDKHDSSSSLLASKLDGRWALWVEKPDPKEPAARVPATAGSGWGREITITTDTERVTIERHQFVALDVQPPMVFVYALGGAESRNAVDMGRGPQEQVARAERKGDTLVISSRHAVGTELETEITQSFSIDADPDSNGTLVVETTRTANGVASRTKARYRRPD